MKNILLFILCIHQLYAQQNSGVLRYDYTHRYSNDTLHPVSAQPVSLYFRNQESFVRVFPKIAPELKTAMDSIKANKHWYYFGSEKLSMNDYYKRIATIKPRNVMYSNFETNQRFEIDFNEFGKKVLVKDTLIEIDWQIKNNFREIGDIKCQKAIGEVKGRTYEAWFAPEIAVSFGPWKLHGLPGLILEAKSTDNQVSFKFRGLKMPLDSTTKIVVLTPATMKQIPTVDWADFEKERYTRKVNDFKFSNRNDNKTPESHLKKWLNEELMTQSIEVYQDPKKKK